MGRHISPPLLITVYGFYGCPEEFSDLLLGFFQGFTESFKFFVIHFQS